MHQHKLHKCFRPFKLSLCDADALSHSPQSGRRGEKNVHRVQDHDKTLQLYAMIATSSTHTDVAPLTPTSHMLWHPLSG